VPENAQLTPIIYDSPHSGRLYEPILSTWKPRATLLELRRGEDAYMDVVLRDLCKKAGVTLLLQHYPRCYLDVNRAADDVDEESLLQEPWPLGARPTEKSRKGLGLIRRLVRPGCPIYEEGEKLPADEVMRRLQLAYWPYHGALTSALHSLTRRHKEVVHINWYVQDTAQCSGVIYMRRKASGRFYTHWFHLRSVWHVAHVQKHQCSGPSSRPLEQVA
jgi:N-formylglutamate amidohydrolase